MEYCFAEVNLAHYAHNLGEIKRYLPKGTKIMAVIKANAYGCGIVEIAKKAVECGIYALGVARIDEAIIARKAVPKAKIVVLGYTPKEFLSKAITHNIELCVYHKDIAEAISREAVAQGKVAQIHIKLDTGMGRIGYLCEGNSSLGMQFRTCGNFGDFADSKSSLNPQNSHKYKSHTANTRIDSNLNANSTQSVESSEKIKSKKQYKSFCYFWLSPKVESPLPLNHNLPSKADSQNRVQKSIESNADSALNEIVSIAKFPNINIASVFTHFSSADEENLSYTQMQCDRYSAFVKNLKSRGVTGFIRHCSNSAGIFTYPQGVFDMVRVGIVSYGISPNIALPIALKPVLSLKARVVHIKTLPKGSAVSYGRTFITTTPTRIATICVGYADGYSRLLSNKAEVLIGGKRVKVVGSVCMDQICVDISGIKGVAIGDEVVLFGVDEWGNEISPDELAQKIGTISYEVLCAVSNRVPRIYKC